MTLAQQLEQTGLKKGLEQGLAQGRQLGEREASLKIARNLLDNGMDLSSVMQVTGLSEEDLQHIHH
ncbi:hypothetical protein PANPB_00113 (plasmid) [Pantoea sp. Nvir]|uniref:hypothetical protein n=1 Tax=Pantoea sp. Nvir TaxID=2576760 RepID=UPI0030CE1769